VSAQDHSKGQRRIIARVSAGSEQGSALEDHGKGQRSYKGKIGVRLTYFRFKDLRPSSQLLDSFWLAGNFTSEDLWNSGLDGC
jgi:hypothetical protein